MSTFLFCAKHIARDDELTNIKINIINEGESICIMMLKDHDIHP